MAVQLIDDHLAGLDVRAALPFGPAHRRRAARAHAAWTVRRAVALSLLEGSPPAAPIGAPTSA